MSLVLKRLLHPFFIISLMLGIFSVVLANDIGVKIFEKSEEIRKDKREEKKEEVDGPMNIFLGALSPVMAVADVKGYQSWIVAIAIIVLPIISMVMIREDNKVFEGIVIIIFPFLSASLIATNSSTSLFAGVGGILSPLILGLWIAGQLLNVARDEVKKELGIETENMKKDRIKREEEQNKLLSEIANKK